ncbi:hypothetical protein NQ317_011991 [Molorchus minor]|uniref:THAP-type domain-containing protein n=1 Tax=Molorchus minor TaxID=1323400 RepID=A0ABQ9JB65_9CUCU|nr:hypothetical protein NQ317_011991 [Molorchus minor]
MKQMELYLSLRHINDTEKSVLLIDVHEGQGKLSRFPTKVQSKLIWCALLGLNKDIPKSAGVCDDHFNSCDVYVTRDGKRRLKIDALPLKIQPNLFTQSSSSSLSDEGSESCPNNISINSHKKHGRWNEKMAETGQEEGKQNIRIEGALLLIQYKRQ